MQSEEEVEQKNDAMNHRRRVPCLLCSCSLFLVLFIVFFYATTPRITRLDYTGPVAGSTGRMYTVRSESCDIIDLAIVVRGYKLSRDAALLVKSVLLFRRNPIRFHFVADPIAKHILSTLMRTWHLYGIDYHFYDMDKKSVKEHKRSHNGIDDFTLLLSDVLPRSVERVISLHPSVLLNADIFDLWKMFDRMQKRGSVLGILRTTPSGASEGEEEFSSDVMVIDYKATREKRWLTPWKDALSKSAVSLSNTSPDVSVVTNALSYLYGEHRGLFSQLNPGWNVQSNARGALDGKAPDPCHKQQTVCARSFRNDEGASHLKQVFQEYDGNLLREKLIDCKTGPEFDQNALDYRARTEVYAPPCTDFKREGSQERRTHPFYLEYDYVSADPNDVTLLLHVTLDRLIPMLEPTCRHWEGPMSIAVFTNDSEVSDLLHLISSSPIIRSRQNIGYHIVYKEGMFYPINPLRDVALENVRTTYVFLNDMDFLPSFRLYPYLKQTVSKFDLSKTVLVVPAFETFKDPKTFPFPRNKSALVAMAARNEVFQFHRNNYPRGHAATDYPTWKSATKPYKIKWQPQYEPYLVASANIPPLDPRFVSRHFNKVSHTEELYYQQYEFYVVSNGFILHLPHALSTDAVKQKSNERHKECYEKRRDEWRADMVERYGYEPLLVNIYKIWNKLSSSYDTGF